jgi:hypothetical protein
VDFAVTNRAEALPETGHFRFVGQDVGLKYSGTALSSDALVIPALDAFSGALLFVDCCRPFDIFEFQAAGTVQSITATSEPNVLMLLIAALFGVGLMRYSTFFNGFYFARASSMRLFQPGKEKPRSLGYLRARTERRERS